MTDLLRQINELKKRLDKLEKNESVTKNNYYATSNPAAGDDIADGYTRGSVWVNTNTSKVYMCLNSSAGAAVWALLN